MNERLLSIRKRYVEDLGEIASRMEENAEKVSELAMAETIKKEMEEMENAIRASKAVQEFQRSFLTPLIGALKGIKVPQIDFGRQITDLTPFESLMSREIGAKKRYEEKNLYQRFWMRNPKLFPDDSRYQYQGYSKKGLEEQKELRKGKYSSFAIKIEQQEEVRGHIVAKAEEKIKRIEELKSRGLTKSEKSKLKSFEKTRDEIKKEIELYKEKDFTEGLFKGFKKREFEMLKKTLVETEEKIGAYKTKALTKGEKFELEVLEKTLVLLKKKIDTLNKSIEESTNKLAEATIAEQYRLEALADSEAGLKAVAAAEARQRMSRFQSTGIQAGRARFTGTPTFGARTLRELDPLQRAYIQNKKAFAGYSKLAENARVKTDLYYKYIDRKSELLARAEREKSEGGKVRKTTKIELEKVDEALKGSGTEAEKANKALSELNSTLRVLKDAAEAQSNIENRRMELIKEQVSLMTRTKMLRPIIGVGVAGLRQIDTGKTPRELTPTESLYRKSSATQRKAIELYGMLQARRESEIIGLENSNKRLIQFRGALDELLRSSSGSEKEIQNAEEAIRKEDALNKSLTKSVEGTTSALMDMKAVADAVSFENVIKDLEALKEAHLKTIEGLYDRSAIDRILGGRHPLAPQYPTYGALKGGIPFGEEFNLTRRQLAVYEMAGSGRRPNAEELMRGLVTERVGVMQYEQEAENRKLIEQRRQKKKMRNRMLEAKYVAESKGQEGLAENWGILADELKLMLETPIETTIGEGGKRIYEPYDLQSFFEGAKKLMPEFDYKELSQPITTALSEQTAVLDNQLIVLNDILQVLGGKSLKQVEFERPIRVVAKDIVGDIRGNKAVGGLIFGSGGPREDKVPIMASPGEYVVNTSSAKSIGYGNLDYMNKMGKLPGFATGGLIGVNTKGSSVPVNVGNAFVPIKFQGGGKVGEEYKQRLRFINTYGESKYKDVFGETGEQLESRRFTSEYGKYPKEYIEPKQPAGKEYKPFRLFDTTSRGMEKAIDYLSEKRLGMIEEAWMEKSGWEGMPKRMLKATAGPQFLAAGELGVRMAKIPAEMLGMLENTMGWAISGNVKKDMGNIVEGIKNLTPDDVGNIASIIGTSFVEDIKKGGLGITAGIIDTLLGVRRLGKMGGGVVEYLAKRGETAAIKKSASLAVGKGAKTSKQVAKEMMFESKLPWLPKGAVTGLVTPPGYEKVAKKLGTGKSGIPWLPKEAIKELSTPSGFEAVKKTLGKKRSIAKGLLTGEAGGFEVVGAGKKALELTGKITEKFTSSTRGLTNMGYDLADAAYRSKGWSKETYINSMKQARESILKRYYDLESKKGLDEIDRINLQMRLASQAQGINEGLSAVKLVDAIEAGVPLNKLPKVSVSIETAKEIIAGKRIPLKLYSGGLIPRFQDGGKVNWATIKTGNIGYDEKGKRINEPGREITGSVDELRKRIKDEQERGISVWYELARGKVKQYIDVIEGKERDKFIVSDYSGFKLDEDRVKDILGETFPVTKGRSVDEGRKKYIKYIGPGWDQEQTEESKKIKSVFDQFVAGETSKIFENKELEIGDKIDRKILREKISKFLESDKKSSDVDNFFKAVETGWSFDKFSNVGNSLMVWFNSFLGKLLGYIPSEEETRTELPTAKISSYATGIDYVPSNQFAYLHKGEAVIPAEYNLGGVVGLPKFAEGGSVEKMEKIGADIGEAIVSKLKEVILSVDQTPLRLETTELTISNTESLDRLADTLSNINTNVGVVGADEANSIVKDFIEAANSKFENFTEIIGTHGENINEIQSTMLSLTNSSTEVNRLEEKFISLEQSISEVLSKQEFSVLTANSDSKLESRFNEVVKYIEDVHIARIDSDVRLSTTKISSIDSILNNLRDLFDGLSSRFNLGGV
ncbi:MAG: hypothetical protein ACTSQY_05420 [Candidatus Odinarchaeia archaeon]